MLNNIIKSYTSKVKYNLSDKKSYSLKVTNSDFNKFLLVYLAQSSSQDIIVVLDNKIDLYSYAQSLEYIAKDISIYKFPSFDNGIYQQISPNNITISTRISTLISILEDKKKKIILTHLESFLQRTIPKDVLKDNFLTLKVGDEIKQEKVIEFLINSSYSNVNLVNQEGEFANRGDIVDVYVTGDLAYRIDFFGDIIEKIRVFDTNNQRTYKEASSLKITKSSEIVLNSTSISFFEERYKDYFGVLSNDIIEDLKSNILPKGIENYLPLFYPNCSTITDYLNNPILFLNDEFEAKKEEFFNNYYEEYEYRVDPTNDFINYSHILSPEVLFIKDEISDILKNHKVYQLSSFIEEKSYNFRTNNFLNHIKTSYKSLDINLDLLIQFIKDNPNLKFLIATFSQNFNTNLKKLLADSKLEYISSINSLEDRIHIIHSDIVLFDEGFIFEDFCLVTEQEITGIKKTFNNKSKKNLNPMLFLSNLSVNDIIVHIDHGFGVYKGIQTIVTQGIDHDYLEILYANNEKLFIPVENIDLITRYSGENENISLDRLGSTLFSNRKNKIKQKVKDIAHDLIKISAKRLVAKAPLLEIKKDAYDNFVKEFPYVETDDQIKAINDIIDDFSKDYPCDRLVCGDVGFGKTEVAMRAAFMMLNSGYQVALIAPTTLLVNQHYNNFVKRFANYPFVIKELSRFVSNSNRKKVKEDLLNHKIDLLIGSHAILSDNVKFKKLGLIIIDEEQSFGVSDKEKLKHKSDNAHLLTLSATPIPRTVQLAFKGLKELSLISTAPVAKLPIHTYVMPLDILSIKKAIYKEKERSGQAYFVVPKISFILEAEKILQSIDKNISYVSLHGQMPTETIEKNMLRFKEKQFDVLISTNIIESGLDLKNVNTIIIYRADKFGLAQLYQLRGRVGRSSAQSFAYLYYDHLVPIKEVAKKRLQVLQSLDYLGASFSLANYDLELRGAGNLLGEEQSGHMKEIGFELYQRFLEQEIKYLKNEDHKLEMDFSPVVKIPIPALIPKNYVRDIETSMNIYQRIGYLKSISEIEDLKDELRDRFGNLPVQLENLFQIIRIKIYAREAFVDRITFSKKGVLLHFFNDTFPNVDALINYITSKEGAIQIRPEGNIFYNNILDQDEITSQITDLIVILKEISSLLK